MELRLLRYFLAVAREESITGATEVLHVTQPTLSRQLSELEEELGAQLLVRGKRKVTLTEKGVLFRQRAEEIIRLAEKAEQEIKTPDLFAGGDIYVAQQPQPVGAQLRCRVHARDISLSLSAATDDSILNRVTAQIEALAPAPTPGHVLVRLNAGGAPLLARVTQRSARALNLAPGMTVFAQIKAVALLD